MSANRSLSCEQCRPIGSYDLLSPPLAVTGRHWPPLAVTGRERPPAHAHNALKSETRVSDATFDPARRTIISVAIVVTSPARRRLVMDSNFTL
ncbi:unnamed protein product [Danaus chrysippus]|uniref:(African queen) hypothetical protein n=1 Tax=Danaus chrysippus TaxID=151541 RepID=A0A8J2QV11_9NEOP|nr:unnamed protein product [Danaus chrysippus]